MPYDPNLPQENALIDTVQMRSQLQGLNDLIALCATVNQAATMAANAQAAATAASSNNSNAVQVIRQVADPNYQPWQMQMIIDKLDELINALRR